MITLRKEDNRLFYYQRWLAVGVVFFFFTFLDSYVVVQQIATSPVGWILPYFFLAIPLFVLGKLKPPSLFILLWCLGYLLIGFTSYVILPPSESALRVLIDRSFSSVFVLVTACLLTNPQVQARTRSALFIATLIGILNNCYQFINPSAFAGLYEGRASGLYMDPNDCSYALVLGMIFTVGLFPQKLRIPWILTVGFGIALTLSRGGLLCWLVVILAMIWNRIITYKNSILWLLGIGGILFIVVLLSSGDSLNNVAVIDENAFERVSGIMTGETLNDPSALERKGIAAKAEDMFLENPIFGRGIGSTSDFSITGFTVSTHNMYLLHAAEYGLFGLPILPLALYASTRHSCGESRKIANIFILFILLASLFSHTVLDQRSYLTVFALMSAMSASSQTYSNQFGNLKEARLSQARQISTSLDEL